MVLQVLLPLQCLTAQEIQKFDSSYFERFVMFDYSHYSWLKLKMQDM